MNEQLNSPLFGAIDRLEVGPESSVVRGWCFDLRSRRPPADLHLWSGGAPVGRVSAYFQRADLGHLGLSDYACGFHTELDRPIPDAEIADLALFNEAGEPVHLLGRPAMSQIFVTRGEIEVVTRSRIVGWICEAEPEAERFAHLVIGGMQVPISAALDRPDLVERGISPRARVGFVVELAEWQGVLPFDRSPFLELWAAGRMLLKTGLDGVRPLGKLEVVSPHGLSGWIAIADQPDTVPTVEVLIDDQPFAILRADQRRLDLRMLGLNSRGGGFNLAWGNSPTGEPSFRVAVRHLETGIDLPGSPAVVTDAQLAGRAGGWLVKPVALPRRAVAIIVINSDERPVSDACLQALRRNTTLPVELMVLDLSGRPPAGHAVPGRRLDMGSRDVRNAPRASGGLHQLNAAVRAAPGNIVLLDGRSCVGPRWLENLVIAAGQGERTGTVSAFTTAGGAFAVPQLNRFTSLPDGWTTDEAARAIAQAAYPAWPSIGLGNAACIYIDRECFDETGGFEGEAELTGTSFVAEFCLRALRAGWRHVLDDRTCIVSEDAVFAREDDAGTLAAYAEYMPLLESFGERADLNSARFRVARALAPPRPAPLPRILYVISTRSGGTPQTNRDLMNGVRERYDPYLLVCDGKELSLFHGADDTAALEHHTLERSIDPILHVSAEYADVVRTWLVRHGIELVHIRHLAWHSLDLPQQCAALGLPVIFSFHDYYMVCPSVKLLDENLRHCGGTCTPTAGACVSELWNDARMPQLKHGYVQPWKARARQMLDACDTFVTTSVSAADIIGRNFPDFAGRLEVIPHGRSFPSFGRAAVPASVGSPFRILIAGGLSRAKGSALVSAAAKELRREGIEFHLLGNADDGLDRNIVTCHGAYERADFIERVAEIGPAIGLLPSLWPETYCHVLTEMWASGLPVLAYDIGAVGERIRAKGGGWLFDEPSAELLCDAIRFLRAHPEEIEGRLEEVHDWQAGEGSQLTEAAMARAYVDLYGRVLKRRQVLAEHAPTLREVSGARHR